jgi:hypothetical protein
MERERERKVDEKIKHEERKSEKKEKNYFDIKFTSISFVC